MYWYRKANSSCQLAAFGVTGSTNPQGFGSVAPKSGKEIAVALEISVWEFYKTADAVKEAKQSESKISRRNKLSILEKIRRNSCGTTVMAFMDCGHGRVKKSRESLFKAE